MALELQTREASAREIVAVPLHMQRTGRLATLPEGMGLLCVPSSARRRRDDAARPRPRDFWHPFLTAPGRASWTMSRPVSQLLSGCSMGDLKGTRRAASLVHA